MEFVGYIMFKFSSTREEVLAIVCDQRLSLAHMQKKITKNKTYVYLGWKTLSYTKNKFLIGIKEIMYRKKIYLF